MSTKELETIAVGGAPRADLLPAEIKSEHRARTTRRRLIYAVLATVLVVLLASGASTYLAFASGLALAGEQNRTAELLVEQQKYQDVRTVQSELGLVEAGQTVGASTEIDWKGYLDQVQGSLPADVLIFSVQIEGASPLVDYDQATAPLQGLRVATLTFKATSPTLPDVQLWLDGLAELPGYADAKPTSVVLDDETTLFVAEITMHINGEAWAGRFADPAADDAADDEETEG